MTARTSYYTGMQIVIKRFKVRPQKKTQATYNKYRKVDRVLDALKAGGKNQASGSGWMERDDIWLNTPSARPNLIRGCSWG